VYSAQGEFLGGAIAPGIATSLSALSAKGAQLPRIELATPVRAVGRSTIEAMRSGAVYGFAGQVDRIVEELVAELDGEAVVVATGGLAPAVVKACRHIHDHDPWLTLKGLRLIWERNA
jgi:type III pantothenate kinase